MKYSVRS
jgi:hypothetical protein